VILGSAAGEDVKWGFEPPLIFCEGRLWPFASVSGRCPENTVARAVELEGAPRAFEVQEASSDSGWVDTRQRVLPAHNLSYPVTT
jgi:hypothetical protein